MIKLFNKEKSSRSAGTNIVSDRMHMTFYQ